LAELTRKADAKAPLNLTRYGGSSLNFCAVQRFRLNRAGSPSVDCASVSAICSSAAVCDAAMQ
jgi:hypothetical protein